MHIYVTCNDKNSVHTSKKTQFTITNINFLMRFKEIISVYTENHTRPVNTKCTAKSKAVPLHAMAALGARGGIAPTHS
jgi:hypothetical protein